MAFLKKESCILLTKGVSEKEISTDTIFRNALCRRAALCRRSALWLRFGREWCAVSAFHWSLRGIVEHSEDADCSRKAIGSCGFRLVAHLREARCRSLRRRWASFKKWCRFCSFERPQSVQRLQGLCSQRKPQVARARFSPYRERRPKTAKWRHVSHRHGLAPRVCGHRAGARGV